ncbi:YihY/virulence factor BrkB family protein [Acidovorax sp. SUPP3334]|uniref:YihY/virulence factor BrkB family protein n=1 Tax=Acidovorax sp. SUPP3334 TaxID=2920881 RepID=UPI0023DE6A33|nr:YihY/virulence factor BrkB family protein [Acidovorax sp. SUPP3334]GKT25561.1 YihY/virulence factor BrkB family protein [Acidovorax sp. SUPP3334]
MSSSFLTPWIERAKALASPIMPLVRAANLWLDADGLRMSAAMSFYGLLSLAPVLLLLVGVLGWWIDKSYLETTMVGQVRGVMGDRVAEVVQLALSSAREPSEGRLASIAGFVLLLSGATGVFVELQSALERLWSRGAPPVQEQKAWWRMASLRVRGLAYVLAIGFLLLISLVVSTVIHVVVTWASARTPIATGPLLQVANEMVAFGIAVLLFVGLMRIGGGEKPPLICLVFGAVVGAILFTVGKQLLALYLATAAVVSAYGAAGSLVVVLMWIYFSSAVLLFSASCARAFQEVREENLEGPPAKR